MDNGEKWKQLQNVISVRSSEDQVNWTIFGIFCATTAILLVALFSDGNLPTNPVGLIIAVVGFGFTFVWYKIQARGLSYVKYYEEILENLERDLSIDDKFAISGWINKENYKRYLGKGPRVRTLMRGCPLVMMVLWGLTTLFFFIKLI